MYNGVRPFLGSLKLILWSLSEAKSLARPLCKGLFLVMRKEARKWLRQSEADLKAAQDSLNDGNYEWSCFQSQQSAEKGLKAYLYNLGYTSFTTHSVKILLKKCQEKDKTFVKAEEAARTLDNYYIPTRYPNGLDADMAPTDYYDKKDAEKCLKYATLILRTVKKYIKV